MIKSIVAAAAALFLAAGPAFAAQTFELGGAAVGVPSTVAYEIDGELAVAVFVRGSDGLMYDKIGTEQGDQWTEWAAVGSLQLKGDPSCTAVSTSRIDCAAIGADGAIDWASYDATTGKWSDWTSLGGAPAGDPSTVTTAEGGKRTLRIFVRGAQDHLFMDTLTGNKWSDWKDLGVTVGAALSCARSFKAGADCYDNSGKSLLQLKDVTHKTGKAIVSKTVAGSVSGRVSAVGTDDFVHLFGLGSHNKLLFNAWTKKWSGWSDPDVTITSAPGCDLDASETEAWCATVGSDGKVTMNVLLDGEI